MERTVGKKIAFGFVWFSVAGALASCGILIVSIVNYGFSDPITASMIASIVFFLSCATVLWVMSRPGNKDVEPWDGTSSS